MHRRGTVQKQTALTNGPQGNAWEIFLAVPSNLAPAKSRRCLVPTQDYDNFVRIMVNSYNGNVALQGYSQTSLSLFHLNGCFWELS